MWAGIVGFVSPLVIQFLAKSGLSRQLQALIAFGFCVVVAGVTVYFEHPGDLTTTDYVKDLLVVFSAAIVAYKGFWNPVGATPSNAVDSHNRP
jgi:hypothetical protein